MTPTAAAAPPGLASAFATWERLPVLAAALAARDAVHLVVDPSDARILSASEAAAGLAAALAGPALASVIRQIVTAAAGDATPRLARLRLDARRIAPPVLCWLARGAQADGRPAILIIPTAPVAAGRARPVRPADAPPDVHAERPVAERAPPHDPRSPPAAPLRRDDRFLWRLDAAGVLTTLTGPEALAGLVGQRWQDLAASGRLSGADAVLAALRDRRTFRGEQAVLDAGTGAFRVDLSGAPLGRDDAAFSGFGGFGLIRSVPAGSQMPSASPEPTPEAVPEPNATPVPAACEDAGPALGPAETGAVADPVAVDADPVAAPLSNDEHAAFREIARALGARYAGDEAEPGSPRTESGAVMPFPAPQAAPAETRAASDDVGPDADAADVGPLADAAPPPATDLLGGLPLPVLVHRDGTIVAANGAFLDLTGHPDLPSLVRIGLSRLLPGLPATQSPEPSARRTTVATVDGGARPVELLAGALPWAGATATCLVVRPVEDADVADALTAERLARAAETERTASAEATLDALETGVVTIDEAGRIVALNRAASGLFGCDPREIVGSSFVTLFDGDSVLTVADALTGTPPGRRIARLAGGPVSLTVAAAQGRRVVQIARAESQAAERSVDVSPDPAPGRADALGRLDGAVREPLTGIIDLAGAMLKEPFGPLGDARYRGCLAEIKASGEAMLERVGKLLDLAAVEAGSLHLEPRALDLNDVVASCVARLQGEAARGRIVVRTSFSTDIGDLEADEPSVSRAASLVIENAIRRSTAGSQIIVSTGSAERAGIAVRVRETGAGHAPRPEAPRSDVEDGLALPRALVEANGGRLQLSARPEDGTLVEIIMPTRRAANG
ncbi:PAS domain-containing sensor histidine kinase [Methylobacterium sp. NMS14P]|uniref:sensor histidine kinase n=1 Tax=Methylobacterium sp. NMS14P TaxID=2894310 RepID=UPI00235920CA|nr:PAS domain-containing protein [Methylobacterium sp. NMS14P]WCS25164.1 PAS domain-containing sensor histidine kinase [Methylobacterium sp. NMS14P]